MYRHILLAYDETDGSKKALDEVSKLMKSSIDSKLTVLHISDEKTANEPRDNFTPTHAIADTSPGFDNQYMGNLSVSPDNKVRGQRKIRHEITDTYFHSSIFSKCEGKTFSSWSGCQLHSPVRF